MWKKEEALALGTQGRRDAGTGTLSQPVGNIPFMGTQGRVPCPRGDEGQI